MTSNSFSCFSGLGEDYGKYRPIHPAAAIDAILLGLTSTPQLVAVDVGAGTGIGARLLADRGIRVVAIEPNANMRLAATPHEKVEFLAGSAEQIPLETASVDLVTSFQAFHWFNFAKSLQEFDRILKPGGQLALVWSFWDQRDPLSRDYSRLIAQASRDQKQQSKQRQREGLLRKLRYRLFWQGLWLPHFTNLRRYKFTFTQQLDLVGLIGLARSQGFTPVEGTALQQLVSQLSTFHQRFCNSQEQVRLSYSTHLYLANSISRKQVG
jgi:SAM-dependent methyltransferase